MSTWKEILAKQRGPRDTWGSAMRKKFEKVLRELEEIKQQMIQQAIQDEGSYRKRISEGTRAGLDRAKKRGVKLGGARDRKSKVSLRRLRELHRSGLTQEQIADILHCSQALVSKLLRGKKGKAQMRRKK